MTSIRGETGSGPSAPSHSGLALAVIFAVILSVTAISCGGTSTIVHDGYVIQSRSTGGKNSQVITPVQGGFVADINGTKVTIKDGRILVDGKDLGAIKKGDNITVYEQGEIKINEEVRKPQ